MAKLRVFFSFIPSYSLREPEEKRGASFKRKEVYSHLSTWLLSVSLLEAVFFRWVLYVGLTENAGCTDCLYFQNSVLHRVFERQENGDQVDVLYFKHRKLFALLVHHILVVKYISLQVISI